MSLSRIAGCCCVLSLSMLISACAGLGGDSAPTPTPTPVAGSLNTSVNHIILFMQENRSFDHYFGQLNAYRAKQTPPLPQDLDTWTTSTDKTHTNVSTPGYDPVTGQAGPPIKAFHMQSACSENLTPSWNETHRIWNLFHTNSGVFTMDGFAFIEGKFAHDEFVNASRILRISPASAPWVFTTTLICRFTISWPQTSPRPIAGFLLLPPGRTQTGFTGWQLLRKGLWCLRCSR